MHLRIAGVVLLFVSVLTNVLLIARGAGRSASDCSPAAEPQEHTRALAQLATEREQSTVLRGRIRELEAHAAALASSGPSAARGEVRGSLYRDHFRRSVPLVGDDASYSAPASYLVISEATLELFRASVRRAEDPAGYAECLRELFDAVLEDGNMKLGGEQSKELRRILDDYREALLRTPSPSMAERSLRDLDTEASVMSQARTLLNEEQYGRVRRVLNGLGLFVQPMSVYGLNHRFLENSLASAWMDSYRLDETQKPVVLIAARGFADALREVELQYRGREDGQGIGTPEGYEIRLRSQRAQLSALKMLENVMTPEQKQRLHSQLLTEFHLQHPSQTEK